MSKTQTSETSTNSLIADLAADLRPDKMLPSLVAGLVAGILGVIFMFSYTAVIFVGDLADFVPIGTGFMLFGAIVTSTVLALFGTLKGTVALPQDNPTAITALLAASVAASASLQGSNESIFVTVVAIMILTTLLAGALFLIVGRLKLGNLIRFIPYPVIGGFLAGTGWLLFKGSFSVMSDVAFDLANLSALFRPGITQLWMAGAIFGVVTLVALNRITHFLILPGLVAGSILLFYLWMWASGTSIAGVTESGWLMEPFGDGGLWQPLSLSQLKEVDLAIVIQQAGGIASILTISILSLLLNITALESAFQRDVDLNHELKVTGIANLASAFTGSVAGYQYVSLSTLGRKMGAESRLVGLFTAAVCAFTLFYGAAALSYFPKFVLGGLIMFVGLSFLYDWVYLSLKRLTKPDIAIIFSIIVAIEAIGFLEGIALGIVFTVVHFVMSYSKINVVRHALSGMNFHSNFDRPIHHRKLLHEKGEQIHILKLHGYIFFGSANTLLDQVHQRLKDVSVMPLRYLIIDFQHVNGLDTSAMHSFVKLKQLAADNGVTMLYTHLSSDLKQHFEHEQFVDGTAEVSHKFQDSDYALEWCEEQILAAENVAVAADKHTLEDLFERLFGDTEMATKIYGYFAKEELPKGQFLMHQGEKANEFYFVESGLLTSEIELSDGEVFRIRTTGPGTIIGAAGMYMKDMHIHLSSVVADEPSIIYRLTEDALEKMKESEPKAAVALNEFLVHHLADRLARHTKLIEDLLDLDVDMKV